MRSLTHFRTRLREHLAKLCCTYHATLQPMRLLCCDGLQLESTPLGIEQWLSGELVRIGMQHAQLP
jgi:hypothetical protein